MNKARSERMLHKLQRKSFDYFVQEYNSTNGLVADSTQHRSIASIAVVGFALTAYLVGVERGFLKRSEALKRTLAALRFFSDSHQGTAPNATGYKGFYYHFLDMKSGRRAWSCELSTIDTALWLMGVLAAARYFNGDRAGEREVRQRSEELTGRVNWRWAQHGATSVSNGWKPERGFLRYRWTGYNEGLLLYIIGLGSAAHSLPKESYAKWTSTYSWRRIYGHDYLFAGPLFTHQFPHVWIDFRGIQDAFMRARSIDYFENSRRATYVQREYAIRNPRKFKHYSEACWGFTASLGPGFCTRKIQGIKRVFRGYCARGVPYGLDDGTIAPWAAVTSLPFAPEIVLPTIERFYEIEVGLTCKYGFEATFNPTFPSRSNRRYGWICRWHFGLNQGALVAMIENYRSAFLWHLMRTCPDIVRG